MVAHHLTVKFILFACEPHSSREKIKWIEARLDYFQLIHRIKTQKIKLIQKKWAALNPPHLKAFRKKRTQCEGERARNLNVGAWIKYGRKTVLREALNKISRLSSWPPRSCSRRSSSIFHRIMRVNGSRSWAMMNSPLTFFARAIQILWFSAFIVLPRSPPESPRAARSSPSG